MPDENDQKNSAKAVTARVISRCSIGGEAYEPNELVIFPADLAETAASAGVIDAGGAAVKYCESQDIKAFAHGKRPEKKSKKSKK